MVRICRICLIGVVMLFALGSMNTFAEEPADERIGSRITDAVIYTEVTPGGQFPVRLEAQLDGMPDQELTADEFSMTGHAENWMDPSLHEFTAEFDSALVKDSVLTLTFGDFADKYFFVKDWLVADSKDSVYSFDSSVQSRVVTPVVDDFTEYGTAGDSGLHYFEYAPEDAEEALPVVVVFHGFGDTNNLRAYRTSVAWAEPEAQKVRPCYVISPVIEDNDYYVSSARDRIYGMLHDLIQKMIDDGKIDGKRVYVMGNSFGGMATVEFSEKYPDFVAAGLALCPALNYSQTALSRLEKIAGIPFYFAQAENDHTIPVSMSKSAYQGLTDAGAVDVNLKIYTDEEMNRAGADPDPDSTFSYHHVEMAVMEDPAYAVWMFAQRRE